jgi:signal transduction histidine kinase/FixJ family two-component response regulator/predicted negative regulator of RcsB-dependent stress response
MLETKLLEHIYSSPISASEMVQACCTVAREQLEVGDFDAGCDALKRWWTVGEWPDLTDLSTEAAAELLLTAGTLSGWVASTRQIKSGQKVAEGFLSGCIALFEQLKDKSRAAEARIELAYCYYREGLFDLARTTLTSALRDLGPQDDHIKGVALIRLAIIERHSGRLRDALALLKQAATLIASGDSWGKGRFHLEFATTLKNLGIAENNNDYLEQALEHYPKALDHFQAVGNQRYAAIVENNQGFLLSSLKRFRDAEKHLDCARKLFDSLGDVVRRAQVDETIAQLYLSSGKYESAQNSIKSAVDTLDNSGEDALLAESLTTHGQILIKLGHRHEAKPILERAQRVAGRCGDNEGAGRALLILIEEMCEQLGDDERREIGTRANQLLANSQQKLTRDRLKACLDRIAAAHAEHVQRREMAVHAEKMAALGELSFGVAHNVNNTLTGILGRAQLLLRTNDPEKIAKGIETIIKSAEDGAQIIRRIQDFARRQPSREFQAVPVSELLKDVCEMSRPRWEAHVNGADIRVTLDADCTASVMGDAVELRETLVNMIYNAVDAMPAGGHIHMRAEECGGRVVLSIADNGTGMTAEVKSRLFDPFFTTKGRGGTGMGLAVSFGIIRRHSGTIDVESEPGRGTTFRISLPLAIETETAAGGNALTNPATQTQNTVRVLVVDDEPAVRDVLQEALETEGYEVLTADCGEQALKLFDDKAGRIDLVFTDIGMPGMNGWDLAREIRKRSSAVPLAIVSGWAEAISCEARQEIKAEWVVPKPFDIVSITEIAKEAASRRHLADLRPEVMNNNVCKLLGM